MPLLNTATKVYQGTNLATKIYKGAVQVWPTAAPWSPVNPAGLVGYWDARDLPEGTNPTWAPRNSNGTIGSLTGTGYRSAAQAVDNPRYMTSVSVNTSAGMTPNTAKAFWFIGTVTNAGSDVASRPCVTVGAPTTSVGGDNGLLWYNYDGQVYKLLGSSYANPVGISVTQGQGVRFLWIANYASGVSATFHTYTANSTATTIGVATYPTTSPILVGKRGDNASNVAMVGSVNACGVYSTTLSAGDIASLRTWANANFGVVN